MAALRGERGSGLGIALLLESDGPGGAERMLLHLAETLRDRGHAVCPVGPATGCGWLATEFRRRGFMPEVFVPRRRRVDWRCLRQIVDILRRRGVDLVHSHEFTMAVYGGAAAGLLRRPHVITMHGGRYFAARWSRRVALRWAITRSAAAVAVSAALQADLATVLRLPRTRFRVLHNGIRPCGGSPEVRRELGIGDEAPLIVAIGNLYPVKGHLVLLQAMRALLGSPGFAGCHLVIAGKGEQEPALRAYVAAHGFADCVHLLGYRDDVADLLAAADIFALPSLSEGVPLALLEAMFAGKGIVASAVGGVPEVVTSEHEGLLVPPGDPGALATALGRLLRDGQLRHRCGAAARLRAEREFSAETMVDNYQRLYADALPKRVALAGPCSSLSGT